MKTKVLYIIVSCLAAFVLVLGTVLIMKSQGHGESIDAEAVSSSKKSTFGIGVIDHATNNIDTSLNANTFVIDAVIDTPKPRIVKREVEPIVSVKSSEMFPNEVYSSASTFIIAGKIISVDEDVEGVYVIDKEGTSTFVNFDFRNLTDERKAVIIDYIQVGRRISAVCSEEGRTLIVNSFKIW
ncbi:hypothetical protein [Pedobacter sp. Leaf132]|uniref:hypothetical protein n=1 Tax=Pedobacter sp. Leaf132 TaxID=2876557 RepID=UPI001E4218C1|nr:hypothetical protein [Pedobacter sp. Leaf132]